MFCIIINYKTMWTNQVAHKYFVFSVNAQRNLTLNKSSFLHYAFELDAFGNKRLFIRCCLCITKLQLFWRKSEGERLSVEKLSTLEIIAWTMQCTMFVTVRALSITSGGVFIHIQNCYWILECIITTDI